MYVAFALSKPKPLDHRCKSACASFLGCTSPDIPESAISQLTFGTVLHCCPVEAYRVSAFRGPTSHKSSILASMGLQQSGAQKQWLQTRTRLPTPTSSSSETLSTRACKLMWSAVLVKLLAFPSPSASIRNISASTCQSARYINNFNVLLLTNIMSRARRLYHCDAPLAQGPPGSLVSLCPGPYAHHPLCTCACHRRFTSMCVFARQESSTQGLLRQADESTGVVYWPLCLASCVAPHVCAANFSSTCRLLALFARLQ